MIRTYRKFGLIGMGLALTAACSSGGSDSDVTRNSLNLGTTSTEEARNGLPFASEGGLEGAFEEVLDQVDDLEVGESAVVTLSLLRVIAPEGGSAPAVQVTDETVTLTRTGPEEFDFTLAVTYAGEEVEVDIAQVVEDESTESIDLSELPFFPIPADARAKENVALVQFFEFTDEEELVGFGHVIAGLETNPDDLVALGATPDGGSVFYQGDFLGAATRLDSNDEPILADGQPVQVFGDVSIEASFSDMSLGGELEIGTYDGASFGVEFDDVDIVGNGFETSNTGVSCGEAVTSCSGTAQVGGAFFGVDAAEVAGLAEFDLSGFDDEGNGERLVGGGGFVAEQEVE
ncbi:hypothetical protein BC777_0523 [Yoonia maricola]|uniref:Transferrin-binding protein B C-lobe/N-lobe beta barrel domain-containing protein n=1 Tax=Yoonia maricola TaxID=420999 RepID=A0A2M8WL97_9RHOB|nr:transferrin-binding protein-like solute binding protein [Yoonia maricola]PJI91690.1 hypothetical protein BC777_0523 [Yoonia maricola]